jgi:hypothetical protein
MAAIDYSCPYFIVGPDGTEVSFNDDTDGNFMGYIDDITGLDSPEVRENAQYRVAGDGGVHDDFYAGRRPFTIAGTIYPSVGNNVKQELLQRAVSRARKYDGQVLWTPTGASEQRMVFFRSQQPCRIQGQIPKTFQMAGVSADYRIMSSTVHTSGTVAGPSPITCTVNNQGDEEAACQFFIFGPLDGDTLVITNNLTGKRIFFYPNQVGSPIGSGLVVGDNMLINMNPTILPGLLGFNVGIEVSGVHYDQYYAINPLATDWTIGAEPGIQTFTLTASGSTGATGFAVAWRDSWI